MEGERLLAAINEQKVVVKDLKNYLGPLKNGSSQNPEKYQLFSLKALKLVIQKLSRCSTRKDKQLYLQLSDILVSSIDKSPISIKNIPAFSFEKLLINLIHILSKCPDETSMECYCLLVKHRLNPEIDTNEEARSLFNQLSKLLLQIVSECKGLQWERGFNMRLMSLEMSYCLHQNDLNNTEVNLVKRYSSLLLHCLKKSKLKEATSVLKTILTKSLYSSDDSVDFIVADYVKIKQGYYNVSAKKQDSIKSLKAILIECGCDAPDSLARFLEKELDEYEYFTVKDIDQIPSDIGVHWSLEVLEDLALIYKTSRNPLHSVKYGHVLVRKAVIVHEQGNSESAVGIVTEAIDIAKSMKTNTNEEKCMAFDLLGQCYFWKAMFIYFEMLKSTQSQTCDEEAVASIASSISCWKTVYLAINSLTISKDEINNYFHSIETSCSHLRMCVSVCTALCLIPQALCSIEILLFLYQWSPVSQASLLACKTHLLITYYGETFVTPEIESVLKEAAEDKNSENCKGQIEAQLALALVYCKRGQFSSCNALLKEITSNSIFTETNPGSYYLLAQLQSITSHYIEAQSEYIPLVDTNTCLTRLTTLSSPVCINCMKQVKADSTCHHTNQTTNNGLTELELAIDSLNLSKRILKSYSILHDTDQPKIDTAEDHVDVPALMVSPSSSDLWRYVTQMLSSLSRVTRLCAARESMKDAVYYVTEGLELAKLLHLRYWKVEFSLLLSEIKDSLDKKDERDDLKEEVKRLLEPIHYSEDTDDLSAVFNKLSLNPTKANIDDDVLSCHPVACCCVECTNPVRLVLVANYLHHLIETHSNRDNNDKLSKFVDQIIESKWPKVCSFMMDNSISVHPRTKKKAHDSHISELLQPILIKNASLNIQATPSSQSTTIIEEYKENIETDTLHIPMVRLRLAELYYTMGMAKLQMADKDTLDQIFLYPVKMTADRTQNTSTNRRPRRNRRAMRAVIDSDDDDLPPPGDSSLLPVSLSGFVPEFITSYQLLSPTSLSSRLTKRLYSILGVCLSIWQTNTAAHLLLHSSYLSFSMDSILWTWRKIRRNFHKQTDENFSSLVLKEIQKVISTDYHPSLDHTPPNGTRDDIAIANLVKSRPILHSLTRPLPQSYTNELIQQLPPDWVYYNMTLVDRPANKGRILVLVRVAKDRECVIIKQPLGRNITGAGSPLKLLQTLLSESSQCSKLTEKRKWWSARRKLDSSMEEFLIELQNKVFGIWKILLLNPPVVPSSPSVTRIATALSSCGIPSSKVWAEILLKGRNAIERKDQFKMILKSLCSGRTCDDLLVEKIYREVIKAKIPDQCSPLVLSACHPLHQFPFESMPLLRAHPVSRMPSLPFLAAHSVVQFNRQLQYIDPRSTYYIINPSGDLKRTEKTFGDWFREEEGWEGVVGTPPTSAQFVYGFEERCVLIYCGHGKGREYLKDGRIQELDCQAAVLQMGCSSGKLENLGGDVEPNGSVLNFLLAGSPSLVVNLWDVTDIDIDLFSGFVIREWLSGLVRTDHYKLLEIVPKARDECKLKYLIGASPVIYGVPPLMTQH